jgi:hypothetical protein
VFFQVNRTAQRSGHQKFYLVRYADGQHRRISGLRSAAVYAG